MNRRIVLVGRSVAVVGLLAAAGCTGLGTWGDVLGGMGMPGSRVSGEVRWVDERDREIEVRSGWTGSTRVRYDSRTRVIYRQRSYPVRALEQGDRVSIEVERERNGELYADRIYVEESVRDRDRDRDRDGRSGYPDYPDARVQRFDGRVGWIDHQRGRFALEAGYGGQYLVTLPYNPSSSTRDAFRRLRRGDRVRVEGELLSRDRIELRRFLSR